MPHKTIKQLRKELKAWGLFWRGKQLNIKQNVSSIEKVSEILKKGTVIDGVSASAFNTSDSINVPDKYQELDRSIESLSIDCRLALVNKYIKGHDVTGYWIDKAELQLL